MCPEYPLSLHAFRRLFSDEAAGRQDLARSCWPEGFQFPRCQHGEASTCRRGSCGAVDAPATTPPSGRGQFCTEPLTQWFLATHLLPTQTPGLFLQQMERQLGLHPYARPGPFLATERLPPSQGSRAEVACSYGAS